MKETEEQGIENCFYFIAGVKFMANENFASRQEKVIITLMKVVSLLIINDY